MEIAAIIGYAMQVLDIVPKLLAAGQDIKGFMAKTTASLTKMKDENRGPTEAEKKELDILIEGLRERLHRVGK